MYGIRSRLVWCAVAFIEVSTAYSIEHSQSPLVLEVKRRPIQKDSKSVVQTSDETAEQLLETLKSIGAKDLKTFLELVRNLAKSNSEIFESLEQQINAQLSDKNKKISDVEKERLEELKKLLNEKPNFRSAEESPNPLEEGILSRPSLASESPGKKTPVAISAATPQSTEPDLNENEDPDSSAPFTSTNQMKDTVPTFNRPSIINQNKFETLSPPEEFFNAPSTTYIDESTPKRPIASNVRSLKTEKTKQDLQQVNLSPENTKTELLEDLSIDRKPNIPLQQPGSRQNPKELLFPSQFPDLNSFANLPSQLNIPSQPLPGLKVPKDYPVAYNSPFDIKSRPSIFTDNFFATNFRPPENASQSETKDEEKSETPSDLGQFLKSFPRE